MTLPAATLDHVVINARDDMDLAVGVLPAAGFYPHRSRLSFARLDESRLLEHYWSYQTTSTSSATWRNPLASREGFSR
jgi:hypothetical protein